jgi:hypothetical protein
MDIAQAVATEEDAFGFSRLAGGREGADTVLDVLLAKAGDEVVLKDAKIPCRGLDLLGDEPPGLSPAALLAHLAAASVSLRHDAVL